MAAADCQDGANIVKEMHCQHSFSHAKNSKQVTPFPKFPNKSKSKKTGWAQELKAKIQHTRETLEWL